MFKFAFVHSANLSYEVWWQMQVGSTDGQSGWFSGQFGIQNIEIISVSKRLLFVLSNQNQTIMLKNSRNLKNMLLFTSRTLFSTAENNSAVEQTHKPKSYRMPVQKKVELYKTEFPLRMHNYRVLLYMNKQHLRTPMLLQTLHFATAIVLIHLIRNNPWYLTFPASLPIMMGLEIFVFARWIIHKRHFKYMIERVYLHTDNRVQFVFSNKIRRKLKDIEEFHYFVTPDELVTPPQNPDGTKDWTQRGTPFPTSLTYKKNEETGEIEIVPPEKPLRYGWTKHVQNYTAYIFPKEYEYANWQVLVPLFNGREIDFEGCIMEQHERREGQNYPPADEQLGWIRQDQIKNEELRKQRLKLKQQEQPSLSS